MSYLKVGLCPALTTEACCALKEIGLQNVTDFVAADLEDVAKKLKNTSAPVSYKV